MRVMIALTVPDDTDVHDLATTIDCTFGDQGVAPSSTVWKWDDFWQDVADDVISIEAGDTTGRGDDPGWDTGERRCDDCSESYNVEEHGLVPGADDIDDTDPGVCVRCSARRDLEDGDG